MKNPYDEKIRHRGIKAVSALRDIVTSHEISDANSSSEEWCHRRVVQALQNDLEALERDQIPGHPRIPESEQGYAVIVRRLHNAHNALAEIATGVGNTRHNDATCRNIATVALDEDRNIERQQVVCPICGGHINTYTDYLLHDSRHESGH